MFDKKIAKKARIAVQDFAEKNLTEVEDLPTIVPATTFLAIEAFGFACAAYANESGQTIEETIKEFLKGMETAGAECARHADKFMKDLNAQYKAEKTTEEILANIKK